MKVRGKEGLNFRRKVKFPLVLQDEEGNEVRVDLTLTSLDLGFERKMLRLFPEPSPHMVDDIDPKSGNPWRDPQGRILKKPNEDDADYKEAKTQSDLLRGMYVIKEALRFDKTLEFESKEDDFDTPDEYYMALLREMEEIGFPAGELKQLANMILDVSGIKTDEKIKEAKRFF